MLQWTRGCIYFFQVNVFIFFGQILRRGIARLYGSFICSSWKNHYSIFHSACTNQRPCQCIRVPFSLHPHWHLFSLIFLIITILTNENWYTLQFWFAFSWCLVMLSTISYVYYPSVCLLWKNVCSDPLPIISFFSIII